MFNFFKRREFKVGDKVRLKSLGWYKGKITPDSFGKITNIDSKKLGIVIVDVHNTPGFDTGWCMPGCNYPGYNFFISEIERW